MAYLLFPGRHLLNTSFQDLYVRAVLGMPLEKLRFVDGVAPSFQAPLDTVVFAITSANQQHSRYNPVPFHARAIGVDRFAGEFRQSMGLGSRMYGIPHFPPSERFAEIVLKEIDEQSEGSLELTPGNCAVLCSTPAIVGQFRKLGFAVLPAELDTEFVAQLGLPASPGTPTELLKRVVALGESWHEDPWLRTQLSFATYAMWRDFPDIPKRVIRLWRDPLLNDSGSLTDSRNYSTYAFQMSNPAILELKYQDIRQAIVEGRIVDEGCADGALLIPIARDFPDSDLIGLDITAEFLARCNERHRAGEFGGTYVHFHQRNILDPVFEAGSIQTTICNSTAHELWSYGQQEDTLEAYLKEKFRQTAPGGRLIIRDVVGVKGNTRTVLLHLSDADGENEKPLEQSPAALSSRARFKRFAQDFLKQRQKADAKYPVKPIPYEEVTLQGRHYYRLTLKDAHEYLMHKDYTDNWDSEMYEEFGFWDYDQWQKALQRAGFKVVVDPTEPKRGSRAYASEWIVQNRWQGQIELLEERNGESATLPWPVTNMVLVAEKPKEVVV